jgi:hypothetical protein
MRRTCLTTLRRITEADIKAAALIDDLDDACGAIQQKAEIEDGGVAGHAFSDIQFDWATASHAERENRLHAWLKLERLYADDAHEPEAP